ncbi:MAG: glycosyltransferase family 4 protein [Pseudomonadota bacterium]
MVTLVSWLILGATSAVPMRWSAAIILGGAIVALVGALDDHRDIPAKLRLGVHFVAAGGALILIGGLPALPVFGYALELAWLGPILAIFGIVWLLNLFNFMDGIDGIAGIEAVLVGLGGAVLTNLAQDSSGLHLFLLTLTASTCGFLIWNFPRARIFMGDAGSGFLGFSFGALAVITAWDNAALLWSWGILLGAFVVDATTTLIRRVLRGYPFDQAHRSHAYQYLARRMGSHVPVSVGWGVVTLLWLWPIAILVSLERLDGVIGATIAYTPLVVMAIRLKAGAPELQQV